MGRTSPARKARLQERRKAEAAVRAAVKRALVESGKTCSGCKHKGYRLAAQMVCELDSDFQGYAPVNPGHICHRFLEA